MDSSTVTSIGTFFNVEVAKWNRCLLLEKPRPDIFRAWSFGEETFRAWSFGGEQTLVSKTSRVEVDEK